MNGNFEYVKENSGMMRKIVNKRLRGLRWGGENMPKPE